MRKQLLSTILCGACLAWGAQAQTSSDPAKGSSSTYPGSSSSSSSASQSGWSSRHMSPTGRMAHEAVRGSQLTGAQITSSSGGQIGTISDTIVNPASGRLEFAVISLSGAAETSSTGTSSTATSSTSTGAATTPGSTSATSSGMGKQVAVPWMLLRPSSTAGTSSSTAGTSSSTSATTGTLGQQPSFVFTGDQSKLESAPNFDPNTDLTQPNWRQSVFSYFGLTGRYGGTGAAETPGGSSTGSQSPSSSGKP